MYLSGDMVAANQHKPWMSMVLHCLAFLRTILKFSFTFLMSLFRPLLKSIKSWSPSVKAAVIAGMLVLLSAFLKEMGTISTIVKYFKTEHIEIRADTKRSGAVVEKEDYMLTFKQAESICVGDDPNDQQLRVFLQFYTGGLPRNISVLKAHLIIPFSLVGDISDLGSFTLGQAYYTYKEGTFIHPSYDYQTDIATTFFFDENRVLYDHNRKSRPLVFSSISHAVDIMLRGSPTEIQFVLYFDNVTVSSNGRKDAVVFDEVPMLKISYVPEG